MRFDLSASLHLNKFRKLMCNGLYCIIQGELPMILINLKQQKTILKLWLHVLLYRFVEGFGLVVIMHDENEFLLTFTWHRK